MTLLLMFFVALTQLFLLYSAVGIVALLVIMTGTWICIFMSSFKISIVKRGVKNKSI